MHCDITDFRVFVNIAEESNLTRGAARSFLSVPAASQRIKNLEDMLGVRLLQRSTQGVTLTEAGQQFLLHAHQVLSQMEKLSGDMQKFGAGVKGKLKIRANTTAITEFLPPVLSQYLQEFPGVNVDLRERLSDDAVRAVRDGAADLGIISGSVLMDGLEIKPFASSHLVAIAPLGHPLLESPFTSLKDMLDHEFVALLDGAATQEFLYQLALTLHKPVKVRVQVAGFDALFRMVESGVGIGVLPKMAVERLNKSNTVGVCELREPWATREYCVCAKQFKELPVFVNAFVEALLRQYAAEPA